MSDENPLLDFLLADLAWGKKPRVRVEVDPTIAADEAFAREIELAREVCEDAEVDARVVSVPIAPLPFGGDDRE